MSAATTAPIPTTLPERAFSLFCEGMRAPAISRQLGVPERTVRDWIAAIRQDIAASERDRLAEEFFRAIEHLHQLSAAAWAAFERDQNLPDPLLASPATPDNPSSPSSTPTPSTTSTSRPRAASHGPRYLRLALDAQRQINNLLSLYGSGASSALVASTPTIPNMPTPAPSSIIPTTSTPHKIEISAESATLPPDASSSTHAKIKISAESATDSRSISPSSVPSVFSVVNPRSSVSSVLNARSPTPNRRRTSRKSRRARK